MSDMIFNISALSSLMSICLCITQVQIIRALQAIRGHVAALEVLLVESNVTKNVTSLYHHVCEFDIGMADSGDVFVALLSFFMVLGVCYSLRCFQLDLKAIKAEKAEILAELMDTKDKLDEACRDILNERMTAENKEAEARAEYFNQLIEVKDKEAKAHLECVNKLMAVEDKEAEARLKIEDLKNQIKEIKVENEYVKEKLSIAEVQVTDGKKALERSEEHVKEYQAAAALAEERISECQVAAAKAEVRANDYQAAATMANIKAEERISEYQVAAAKAEARADKSAADAEDRVSDQTKLAFDLSEVVKVQVEQTLAESVAVKKLVEQITERLPRIETEAFRRGREAGLAEARQPAKR